MSYLTVVVKLLNVKSLSRRIDYSVLLFLSHGSSKIYNICVLAVFGAKHGLLCPSSLSSADTKCKSDKVSRGDIVSFSFPYPWIYVAYVLVQQGCEI